MNQEELIKLKIEQLKDQKENLKFGWDKFMQTHLFIIGISMSLIIGIMSYKRDLLITIISIISIIIVMIFFDTLLVTQGANIRFKKMNEKAKEIEKLYKKLLR